MSYTIQMTDAHFSISKELESLALAVLKKRNQTVSLVYGELSDEFPDEEIQKADSLEEVLLVCGWTLERDGTGTINNIFFEAENSGGEDDLMDTLGPFVTKGSYIAMSGESGEVWKWEFDGKRCKREDV